MFDAELERTRGSLHAVAELVLAGPQHRADGTIRLRVSAQGFRTSADPALAVVGTDLVLGDAAFPISGRTATELAAAVGLVAGAPVGLYAEGSGARAGARLLLDPAAAARIAEAHTLGDAALRLLAPDVEPVLWPEHFDVAILVDGVNYGVSPGDAFLGEPYAYVAVDPVPVGDPFWNAPFGAARPVTAFRDARGLRDFFLEGRHHRA